MDMPSNPFRDDIEAQPVSTVELGGTGGGGGGGGQYRDNPNADDDDNGSYDDRSIGDDVGSSFVEAYPTNQNRNRKYGTVFALMLFFLAVTSYLHFGGSGNEDGNAATAASGGAPPVEFVDGELEPVPAAAPDAEEEEDAAAATAANEKNGPKQQKVDPPPAPVPAVAKPSPSSPPTNKPTKKPKTKHTAKPSKSPTESSDDEFDDADADDDDEISVEDTLPQQDDLIQELEVVEEVIGVEVDVALNEEDEELVKEEEEELVKMESGIVEAAIQKEMVEGSLDVEEGIKEIKDIEENEEKVVEEEEEGGVGVESAAKEESEEKAALAPNQLLLPVGGMTTIKKTSPDSKTGGMLHLSVAGTDGGDPRMSYVRFELSPLAEDAAIESVTLLLHLVEGGDDAFPTVAVDALPHGGYWKTGTVSWNDRPESRGQFRVGTFDAAASSGEMTKKGTRTYEVDVTSAIADDRSRKRMTFLLSADSGTKLDFAGKTWRGGRAMPELLVTLSDGSVAAAVVVASEEKPTEKPKHHKRTARPTKSPTKDAVVEDEDGDDDDDVAMTAEQDDVFEVLDVVKEELEELGDQDDNGGVTEVEKDALVEVQNGLIEAAIEKEMMEGSLEVDEGLEEIKNIKENEAEEGDDDGIGEEDANQVSVPNELTVKADAMTTIKKSSPDSKTGGMLHLTVSGEDSGDSRASFVRFELSPLIKDTDVVAKATLYLYLVTFPSHLPELEESIPVAVNAFPHGGHWQEGTVSWNEPPEERGHFYVGTFDAVALPSGKKRHTYKVDVTSAIDATKKRMTFRLSTESGVKVDFAGRTWGRGHSTPELVMTLAE